ncbi:tRNA dihydrouridine synthase DusB [Bosea sp. SSUT16]|uniref:tRNA-dihydrouridine synthase n=1 Tax=Bosea spartocytisi TaxID=2773451 RepID=A0A927EAS7_9HYPH|nr:MULTISPECIES: tRNA dihydrouridine synthase DusB [Bosea]MBD3847866.1 tRNA dihydrouridine synthase DusB [Bosea spartocytisi]MCT4471492.1 tRNA dihydrouridine synthase DusB [Bosea spartocytisi]
MQIAGIPIQSRAFLAPMSGVTDIVMRRIAGRFRAGILVSEMVASDEFVRGSEEARIRAEGQGVSPHVVQLAGCDPHWLGEAARLAEANGADIVDINMGCPAKKVTGGWAGSALMRDLDHAVSLVEAAVAAVKVPVTVKMRLGWDDASRNAPELARRAVAAGARLITVHGRTRQQFYKGKADWRAIAAVRAAGDFPLVANGDIHDVEDARACLDQSGADFIMVGRAALGRPWLVGAIGAALDGLPAQTVTLSDKLAMAREHYEGLLTLMGIAHGVRHARKHLAAYADDALADGCEADPERRRILLTSEEPRQVIAALSGLFSTDRCREAA